MCTYKLAYPEHDKLFLLVSDDPSAWAVLLATCHAENTMACLHNTQPKRTNLGEMIAATISTKSKVSLAINWDDFPFFFCSRISFSFEIIR